MSFITFIIFLLRTLILTLFSWTIENNNNGTSLVVQWLRLHAPNARGLGSIPGLGTRSLMPQEYFLFYFIYFYFILFYLFFIQQVLISHQFYTHQCIHVNPNLPIHHTTTTPATFPPWCPYICSLHLCLYFCPANRFICTIFLGSTYMR